MGETREEQAHGEVGDVQLPGQADGLYAWAVAWHHWSAPSEEAGEVDWDVEVFQCYPELEAIKTLSYTLGWSGIMSILFIYSLHWLWRFNLYDNRGRDQKVRLPHLAFNAHWNEIILLCSLCNNFFHFQFANVQHDNPKWPYAHLASIILYLGWLSLHRNLICS